MGYDPIFPTTKGILRKLGGDKISSKVFTYDGKAEELEKFPDISEQYTYAKIAKDAPSLHTLKKIGGTFANGSQIEASAEELTIETAIDGDAEVAYMTYMGSTVPFLVYSMGNLFVYSMAGFGYCSKVEFAETIVPIDPKYLPGVCLPVVELSTVVSAGAALTEREMALLSAAYATGKPVVVSCVIDKGALITGQYVFNNFKTKYDENTIGEILTTQIMSLTVGFSKLAGGTIWNCEVSERVQ